MRWFVEIFCLFAALSGAAFDSAAWLEKRNAVDREAARLRTAYAQCAQAVQTPGENVIVPLESHPDGSVKTSVFAERAQFFLKEGLVWGKGVKIRQYRQDGALEAWIEADNCVVDRKTRNGWVQGRVKAKYRDEVQLEGRGVYFTAEGEFLTVYSEALITTPERTLRSVRADYDHKEGVALFDGRVHLTGREKEHAYAFETDRAYAFLSGTNDLRRIVALGNVKVESESRRGACARAEYRRTNQRITLYGDSPASPARLEDGSRRKSVLEGSRIVFWLDSEQVEVTDSRISVETKGLTLPKGSMGK